MFGKARPKIHQVIKVLTDVPNCTCIQLQMYNDNGTNTLNKENYIHDNMLRYDENKISRLECVKLLLQKLNAII